MIETELQRHFDYVLKWVLALCGILLLAGIYYQQTMGNNSWLLLGLPAAIISILFIQAIWMFRGIDL